MLLPMVLFSQIRSRAKEPASLLAIIMLLSAVLRIGAVLTTAVISHDGVRYTDMARLFYEGRLGDAMNVNPMHPLYPLLMAFGYPVFGSLENSALFISIGLGTLTLIPLYFLFRDIWNVKIALLACLLYGFLPVIADVESDVMTEGCFFFFFVSSVALIWFAFKKQRWHFYLLAGLTSACAYWTRPEGIYLLPLFLGTFALHLLSIPRLQWRLRNVCLGALLFMILFSSLSYPFLLYVRQSRGYWSLTPHDDAQGVVDFILGKKKGVSGQVDSQDIERYKYRKDIYMQKYGIFLRGLRYIFETVAKVNFYILLPFLILGFFCLKREEGRLPGIVYILAIAMGYLIPPFLAPYANTSFSNRYIQLPFILLLPMDVLGILCVCERFASFLRWESEKVIAAFLMLFCVVASVNVIKPSRRDKIGLKEGGLFIREHYGPNRKLLSTDRRPEYYAQGVHIAMPQTETIHNMENIIESQRPDFILIDNKDLSHYDKGLLEWVEQHFVRVAAFPTNPSRGVDTVFLFDAHTK